MSAKRVKAPPAPQSRPPPKIRHCAMASPPMEEGETEANEPSTVAWNKKDLLAIDCAFQVHLRRSSFSRKSGIALQDALTLIAKAALQEPPPSLEGKSVSEGVLYHFLLATPSFYQLRRIEKDSFAGALKSGAPKETTWVLESLSSREGRSISEDTEKSDMSPKTRQDILTALKSLDRPTPTGPSSVTAIRSTATTKAPSNPVILGATVEERVRARADSRKRRIQQQQQTVDAKSSTSLDRAWLLRLADALWSHAASILSQRDRLVIKTKPSSTTQGMVTMTVQDVVLFLQRASQTQQSSTASGIAVAAGRTPGTVTKRQMLQYFHELRRDMPGWITLSSDDDMETAPDTTVWIKPHAYKALRNKMSNDDDDDDKVMAVPTKKKRPLLADYVHKVKGQQSVFATPAAAQKPAAVVTAETPNNKQKQHYDTTAPLGIRVRSTSSAKRPAQDDPDDMVEETDHRKRQKRGVLRINYNLCLTEADRVGGEIIQPSFKASPRALKRLFLRMNAGERI